MKATWASHIDKETGRPVETEVAKKLRAGERSSTGPRRSAARIWPHAAFSRRPA